MSPSSEEPSAPSHHPESKSILGASQQTAQIPTNPPLNSSDPVGVIDSIGNGIRSYLSDLFEILFQPTRFYRSLNLSKPVAGSLAFATVTHWVGAAINHLWEGLYQNLFSEAKSFFRNGIYIAEDVVEMSKGSSLSPELSKGAEILQSFYNHWLPFWNDWAKQVERVLLDPFFTLTKIFLYSVILLLGARLFLKSKHYTFRSLVNILCYSYAPSLFLILPLMGGFLGNIYSLVLLTIGIRELAREPEPIGVFRAAAVAGFPYILLYSFALFILAIMLVGILTLIGAFFWHAF